MRWWLRKTTTEHCEPAELPDCEGLDDAVAALEEAMSRWPEVHKRSHQMRQLRHANHFSETLIEPPWKDRRS